MHNYKISDISIGSLFSGVGECGKWGIGFNLSNSLVIVDERENAFYCKELTAIAASLKVGWKVEGIKYRHPHRNVTGRRQHLIGSTTYWSPYEMRISR